jgi:heme A synthase
MLVVASSALGIWRWLSYRSSPEWLLEWQLLTVLGFYFVSLAVGAWMVPSNLANLDTAVLVLDTLIVLALMLRLLTTLESTSDYEHIGGNNSNETTRLTQPHPQPPAVPVAISAASGEPTNEAQPL